MGPIGKTEDRWVGGSAGGRGVLTLVGGSVYGGCHGSAMETEREVEVGEGVGGRGGRLGQGQAGDKDLL